MRYLTFGVDKTSYKICILVNDIRKDEIERAYLTPYGIDPNEVIVVSLHQTPGKKKTTAAEMKAYISQELKPVLDDLKVEQLLVADGDYFKTLTKAAKVDALVGYVLPTEFGDWRVTYVPNYRTIFYDPEKVNAKIAAGVNAVKAWMAGTYQDPGIDIIKFDDYPSTIEAIAAWLERLHAHPVLTCDIEGFSLKHYSSGIGTIGFAWNQEEGIAFPVDILDDAGHSLQVRDLLCAFFRTYKGTLLFHKIDFDVTVLIYQLFMNDILDNEGLLHGLEVMLRSWDCTRIISYLATNSCAGNALGLKDQSQEYAGNYAVEEIKDIRKIPLPKLLQYNLVDCLSTWFVYNKHWPTVLADQQLEVYEQLFKPAMRDIIQMQLTGMPVDIKQVAKVKQVLEAICADAEERMQQSQLVQAFTYRLNEKLVAKKNAEYKKKRITLADVNEVFNPASSDQLTELLFEQVGLPVIARTKTKAPSTKGDVLKSLQNHTTDPEVLYFLDALIDYKAVAKILEAFIPALESAQLGPDGWYYLFGNFNLGGTVSGRLSSSGPNLQNLPANVFMTLRQHLFDLYQGLLADYVKGGKLSLGKLIKSCFKAPPGWFFCGIDFNSLEDRISALTTKDKNKLKVYTDGYDGHSLRAHAYFGDQMVGDFSTVAQINAIQDNYKELRQDSKTPTFLLTYGGTYIGIMQQCGWDETKAKSVEHLYHELYKESDAWVQRKLDQASKDGYVTVAFGLRVRTPLLAQVIRSTSKTPFQAEAEGRTAGNALGQSWCLLNSRAGSEFLGKVRQSRHRHEIRPCAQIHDAQYLLVKDDIDTIRYTNEHIVIACQWQDNVEIWHDTVKLGGQFSIFYPDWSQEIGIPNGATEDQVYTAFGKHLAKLDGAKKAA